MADRQYRPWPAVAPAMMQSVMAGAAPNCTEMPPAKPFALVLLSTIVQFSMVGEGVNETSMPPPSAKKPVQVLPAITLERSTGSLWLTATPPPRL